MIGFCAATIKFQDKKILSFLQVLNGSRFYVIPAIVKFVRIMAKFIKYLLKVGIYLFVKIRKMCAAVMITGIGQIEGFIFWNYPVKPVTVAMFMRNAITAHGKQLAAGWLK